MERARFTVDTRQFISAVSLALDLAQKSIFEDNYRQVKFEVPIVNFNPRFHNFMGHSNKTALVTLYIAQKLEIDPKVISQLFIASLLHDIGSVHAFSLCHSDSGFILHHSEYGSEIIKDFNLGDSLPEIIRLHHENHDGSGPLGFRGNEIPLEARIIHLADYFELMFAIDKPYWLQRDSILNQVQAKKGSIFDPDSVDALIEAAQAECFWLDIENIDSCPGMFDEIMPVAAFHSSTVNVRDLARAFSKIIDMKSQFTLEHSNGLAVLAKEFSCYYNFSDDRTEKIEIAAMLHDLGKLSIPNHILDKPGKLTKEEFTIVKSHTYYTKRILRKIKGFEDIANWAANHHETLKGSGYPEGLTSEELSLESRIMSVCDIYQALTENRPYRKGMDKANALGILDSLVEARSIDGRIVKDLKEII